LGGTVAQTREHLLRHCSRWKHQQRELWKEVGKATGWKAGRCRKVQISELFSMEICDKAVMDFLAATDVGKFPPGSGRRCLSFLVPFLFYYFFISGDGG
jgi:hypothetical protein